MGGGEPPRGPSNAAQARERVAGPIVDESEENLAETDPQLTPVSVDAMVSHDASEAVPVLPDLAELEALLAQAQAVVEEVTISEEEAEAMLQRKTALTQSLQQVPQAQQKKSEWLSRVKSNAARETRRLSSTDNWTDDDLTRFAVAGLIEQEYAAKYSELRTQAKQLETMLGHASGPGNAVMQGILDKLQPALQQIETDLSRRLSERAEQTAERITTIREKITRVYREKAERLQAEIDEITTNLGVQRVLHERTERATAQERAVREAVEQARAAAAAAGEQRRMEALRGMFTEVQQAIANLEGVHGQAWNRLEEVTGIKDLRKIMLDAYNDEDEKNRTATFDRVREKLAQAIRSDQSNKRLQSMSEIAPWQMKMEGRYGETMSTLNSSLAKEAFDALGGTPEQAATRNAVVQEQDIFDQLYGLNPQMATKQKAAKPGVVYRALAERQAAEQAAARASRITASEAKQATQREARELRERLLQAGGFEITDDRGRTGVIQIEEEVSRKGNSVVRVVGVSGDIRGVGVGSTSDPSLRSFPQWFQQEIRRHREGLQGMVTANEPMPVVPPPPPVETANESAEPILSEYALKQLGELESELAKNEVVTEPAKAKIVADFKAAVDGKTDTDEIGAELLAALDKLVKAEKHAVAVAASGGRKRKK